MKSSSILKLYCESLDKFVAIKECSIKEASSLTKDLLKTTGKKSYRDLILTYCVVEYFKEVEEVLKSNLSGISDLIKEDLYNICIKVNPGLNINDIRITVNDPNTTALLVEATSPENKTSNIKELDRLLAKDIIGQNDAIRVIANTLRRSYVGLKDPHKPVCSFTFVGQTGVGKTEMAKALQRILYNGNDPIRIDCSEYSLPHEYAKLIGSPPGFVGHNEGAFLTESMKKKPQSVVLFDEIEKAHRKVHNILLQILDEGRLTDSRGALIDFRQAIIILTSNIGATPIGELESAIGFGKKSCDQTSRKKETIKDFEKNFPPEFINRIDEIIVFKDLSIQDKRHIAIKLLTELCDRTQKLEFYIEFSEAVPSFLVAHQDNAKYGARTIQRAINRFIENPLSEKIMNNEIKKGSKIKAVVKNDEIRFKRF